MADRRLIFPERYRDHLWYASFVNFHKENPHVLDMISSELARAKEAGITKVSIKTIIGHIRWNMAINTRSSDYKINDAYTSLYAILIEHSYPEYAGMFEQRELRCRAKV